MIELKTFNMKVLDYDDYLIWLCYIIDSNANLYHSVIQESSGGHEIFPVTTTSRNESV